MQVDKQEFGVKFNMDEAKQKYCVISCAKDSSFSPFSSDNKPYDAVFYMEEYTRNDLVCAYEITIQSNCDAFDDNKKCIALIGRMYGDTSHCTFITNNILYILVDDYLAIVDLDSLTLISKVNIISSGTGIALYDFDNGLLVHGEIEIIKTDYAGNKEWSFSGRDIWVTMDGTDALRIVGNNIHLRDFYGDIYILNSHGEEI